jgi:hypothetical protein
VRPQDLSEASIVSHSSRSESLFRPLSASKAHVGTMPLPLNGIPLLPATMNLETNHMSLYLNGAVGAVASSASRQKLREGMLKPYLHPGISVLQLKHKF